MTLAITLNLLHLIHLNFLQLRIRHDLIWVENCAYIDQLNYRSIIFLKKDFAMIFLGYLKKVLVTLLLSLHQCRCMYVIHWLASHNAQFAHLLCKQTSNRIGIHSFSHEHITISLNTFLFPRASREHTYGYIHSIRFKSFDFQSSRVINLPRELCEIIFMSTKTFNLSLIYRWWTR